MYLFAIVDLGAGGGLQCTYLSREVARTTGAIERIKTSRQMQPGSFVQECGLQESHRQPCYHDPPRPRANAHCLAPFCRDKDQSADVGGSRPVCLAGVLKAEDQIEQEERQKKRQK